MDCNVCANDEDCKNQFVFVFFTDKHYSVLLFLDVVFDTEEI